MLIIVRNLFLIDFLILLIGMQLLESNLKVTGFSLLVVFFPRIVIDVISENTSNPIPIPDKGYLFRRPKRRLLQLTRRAPMSLSWT